MGEKQNGHFQLDFNASLKISFRDHGSPPTVASSLFVSWMSGWASAN
jgi:hypothetical protein